MSEPTDGMTAVHGLSQELKSEVLRSSVIVEGLDEDQTSTHKEVAHGLVMDIVDGVCIFVEGQVDNRRDKWIAWLERMEDVPRTDGDDGLPVSDEDAWKTYLSNTATVRRNTIKLIDNEVAGYRSRAAEYTDTADGRAVPDQKLIGAQDALIALKSKLLEAFDEDDFNYREGE